MKISLGHWVLIPLLAIGVVAAGVACRRSQDSNGAGTTGQPSENPNSYLTKPIVFGHGIGDIEVYQSTLGQVTAILGDGFQRFETEGSFSSRCVDGNCDNHFQKFWNINIEYNKLGLSFVFRKIEGEDISDGDLKLRFIRISCVKGWLSCKFEGKTDRGIGLKSLRKDVVAAHGPSSTFTGRQGTISYRQGINFSFVSENMKIKDTDPIEYIDIFSPSDFEEFGHRSI
jgi:hypothetical protein